MAERQYVEILANGQRTGIVVDRAKLLAARAATLAHPRACLACCWRDPYHAAGCRNAGRPHPLCLDCGEYNSHAADCPTRGPSCA